MGLGPCQRSRSEVVLGSDLGKPAHSLQLVLLVARFRHQAGGRIMAGAVSDALVGLHWETRRGWMRE